MQKWLFPFIAGFLATLTFHQAIIWLFHKRGLTPRAPWAMDPTWPFRIPSVISLAFWGGVWGIVLIALISRWQGPAFWLAAAGLGGLLPTLVAIFVVMPLKKMSLGAATPKLFVGGLIVNAAWGIGTAVFYKLMAR